MTVINCLIYNGSHAAQDDVQGTINALNTPDFKVNLSGTIDAKSLTSDINVLLIPGGDGGLTYLQCGDFNEKDIQDFIYNGGAGYFVCAASYVAAKQAVGVKNYVGWGVAPTVIANGLTDDEPNGLLIKVLNILGISGLFTINHFQGPFFTDPTNTMTVFATFADNQTGHEGAAAIVGEKYGKGYSVLSSVHPENKESTYTLVQNLVKLANNGGNSVTSFVIQDLEDAGSRVKSWIETNKKLPAYVAIKGLNILMPDYLYLTTGLLVTGTTINTMAVKTPIATTENFKAGTLTKADYENMALRIKNYIEKYGQAPAYASTSLGNMPFEDLIYNFSRIWAVAIPASISCTPLSAPIISAGYWEQLEKGTGKTFNNLTALTLAVEKYCTYNGYFNNQKTFPQELQSLEDDMNGKDNGIVDEDNCVDFAECCTKLAREKGYGATLYGVYCPVEQINHAVVHITGGEFVNNTCVINGQTLSGIIIDWAKLASDGGAIGTFWCDINQATENPSWLPYE